MRLLIICLITQSLIHELSYSQSLPELNNVKVSSNIQSDETENLYFFNYSVENGINSNAAIIRFVLDISRESNTSGLDTAGIFFQNEYDRLSFNIKYPLIEDSIVAVGFSNVPQYWNGSISDSFEAWFSTQRNRNDILPGYSLSGFQLMSKGLPSIRSFKVLPFLNVDELYPSEFDINNPDSLFEEISKDRERIEFHGTTIGPKGLPFAFIPEEFLNTLINYQNQSCELGWISNPGICRSLQANLDNVKRQLEQGRTQTAINNLQAFLNEVEAIRDQQLSPEAYALLKFNGEYLLEKLQE